MDLSYLDACIEKLRDIPSECTEKCSPENFEDNEFWCLQNCEARASDFTIPQECIKIIRNKLLEYIVQSGMDPSIVEPLDEVIEQFRELKTGDILLPEDVNNINTAIRIIRDILSQLGAPALPTNPSGYNIYTLTRALCEKGYDFACQWLYLNLLMGQTYFAAYLDFIEPNLEGYPFIGTGWGDWEVYINSCRVESSTCFIEIADLETEYNAFAKVYGEQEEYHSELLYINRYGFTPAKPALALAVKLKEAANLTGSVPFVHLEFGSYSYIPNNYLLIGIDPNYRLVIEYTRGSPIVKDVDLSTTWLFIVSDIEGFVYGFFDQDLNEIMVLDIRQLNIPRLFDPRYLLEILKGYWKPTKGKATFQYDWVAVLSL